MPEPLALALIEAACDVIPGEDGPVAVPATSLLPRKFERPPPSC